MAYLQEIFHTSKAITDGVGKHAKVSAASTQAAANIVNRKIAATTGFMPPCVVSRHPIKKKRSKKAKEAAKEAAKSAPGPLSPEIQRRVSMTKKFTQLRSEISDEQAGPGEEAGADDVENPLGAQATS